MSPDSAGAVVSGRVSVDVGGTFTDVVLQMGALLQSVKVPSTYPNPGMGVINGIAALLETTGLPESAITEVVHATTAATNSLLERTGAVVGCLVTDGFGDLFTIARLRRLDPFDLEEPRPTPLVRRDYVIEVLERIDAAGAVVRPISLEPMAQEVRQLVAAGVEAFAVCFLHAYKFPQHELAAADVIRREAPGLPVFLSHQVLPQPREYERASTTAIAAYLGPLVSTYLGELGDRLRERGLPGAFLVMKSGGGLATDAQAVQHPEELVESGPAAGVIGAADLGRRLGIKNLIAFDMGGTTAKAALVTGGRHEINYEYEVGGSAHGGSLLAKGTGYPLRTPVVDLAEVGTGGGSIAWVDEGGALQVGPRSAGAVPGPACYGLGGLVPTVTDAYVQLGLLRPSDGSHLGRVDRSAASKALAAVGAALDLDADETARGVLRLATAQMSDAVRMVTVAKGHDPRDFALVATGGAGPIHAWAIAEQLGIDTVVLPPLAGVHSAVGLIGAAVQIDRAEGLLVRSDVPGAPGLAAARLVALADEARADLTAQLGRDPARNATVEYSADVRYVGQSYELNVAVPMRPAGADLEGARANFDALHERLYGHARPDAVVDFVSIRVTLTCPSPPEVGREAPTDFSTEHSRRKVDFGQGFVECAVMAKSELTSQRLTGPLVVENADTTVVVPPTWSCERLADGTLTLRKERRA